MSRSILELKNVFITVYAGRRKSLEEPAPQMIEILDRHCRHEGIVQLTLDEAREVTKALQRYLDSTHKQTD